MNQCLPEAWRDVFLQLVEVGFQPSADGLVEILLRGGRYI